LSVSSGEERLLYDRFWKSKALPSAQSFAWKLVKNKVTTKVNLDERGVKLANMLCVMCGKEGESITHLF